MRLTYWSRIRRRSVARICSVTALMKAARRSPKRCLRASPGFIFAGISISRGVSKALSARPSLKISALQSTGLMSEHGDSARVRDTVCSHGKQTVVGERMFSAAQRRPIREAAAGAMANSAARRACASACSGRRRCRTGRTAGIGHARSRLKFYETVRSSETRRMEAAQPISAQRSLTRGAFFRSECR